MVTSSCIACREFIAASNNLKAPANRREGAQVPAILMAMIQARCAEGSKMTGHIVDESCTTL